MQGVDINGPTEYGWTVLHWAARGKKDEDGHWHPVKDVMQVRLGEERENTQATTQHSRAGKTSVDRHQGS